MGESKADFISEAYYLEKEFLMAIHTAINIFRRIQPFEIDKQCKNRESLQITCS